MKEKIAKINRIPLDFIDLAITAAKTNAANFKNNPNPYLYGTFYNRNYKPMQDIIQACITNANTPYTRQTKPFPPPIDSEKMFNDPSLTNWAFSDDVSSIYKEDYEFSASPVFSTGGRNLSTIIKTKSGSRGIAGKIYPGNTAEIAGQKLAQLKNPIQFLQNLDIDMQQGYFAALYDNDGSAIINMVYEPGARYGMQILEKDQTVRFPGTDGKEIIVKCISGPDEIGREQLSDGDTLTLETRTYTITHNGITKTIPYIGFKGFDDKAPESPENCKAKNRLMDRAINYLEEKGGLKGRVISNCSEGQNRSNFANFSIIYRRAINNVIDQIIIDNPDINDQIQEVVKLQEYLHTEIDHSESPGYTHANALAEALRADLETQTLSSSKQRDQVLAFADHETNIIIEKRLAQIIEPFRRASAEETKDHPKSIEEFEPIRATTPQPAARITPIPEPIDIFTFENKEDWDKISKYLKDQISELVNLGMSFNDATSDTVNWLQNIYVAYEKDLSDEAKLRLLACNDLEDIHQTCTYMKALSVIEETTPRETRAEEPGIINYLSSWLRPGPTPTTTHTRHNSRTDRK